MHSHSASASWTLTARLSAALLVLAATFVVASAVLELSWIECPSSVPPLWDSVPYARKAFKALKALKALAYPQKASAEGKWIDME